MNTRYSKYEPIFGSWYIKDRIGQGSTGEVLLIEREDLGSVYRSALKCITIPQSEEDVLSIKSNGMTDQDVMTYYSSFMDRMKDELTNMARLKGNSNVVSYEDHMVIPHEDGVGWDILIRLELLTPLLKYCENDPLSEKDVIKLGIDMCKALELCSRNGIIHRDIKPENMFVSPSGDFKLGDFGISRMLEETRIGLSRKGTYTYMAPEVFKGEAYGARSDIYSLGLVLYKFLNGGRNVFMPGKDAPIRFEDNDRAFFRRMSGAMLPTPADGSEKLKSIVLRACSYMVKDRYRSAAEMREDLEDLAYEMKKAEHRRKTDLLGDAEHGKESGISEEAEHDGKGNVSAGTDGIAGTAGAGGTAGTDGNAGSEQELFTLRDDIPKAGDDALVIKNDITELGSNASVSADDAPATESKISGSSGHAADPGDDVPDAGDGDHETDKDAPVKKDLDPEPGKDAQVKVEGGNGSRIGAPDSKNGSSASRDDAPAESPVERSVDTEATQSAGGQDKQQTRSGKRKAITICGMIVAMIACAAGIWYIMLPKEITDVIGINDTETIYIGDTQDYKYDIEPDRFEDEIISFESSDPDVLTVDRSGNITGESVGDAVMTLKVMEFSKDIHVNVVPKVTDIKGIKTSISLYEGKTSTLKPELIPEKFADETISYKSSDKDIATVSKKGKIKAKKKGKATITISSGGCEEKVKVTVKKKVAAKKPDTSQTTQNSGSYGTGSSGQGTGNYSSGYSSGSGSSGYSGSYSSGSSNKSSGSNSSKKSSKSSSKSGSSSNKKSKKKKSSSGYFDSGDDEYF